MRDLTLVIMLLSLAWMAWRLPWVGLLGLLFIGILHPQNYAADFMRGFPAYSSLMGVVFLSLGWQLWWQRVFPPVLGLAVGVDRRDMGMVWS